MTGGLLSVPGRSWWDDPQGPRGGMSGRGGMIGGSMGTKSTRHRLTANRESKNVSVSVLFD